MVAVDSVGGAHGVQVEEDLPTGLHLGKHLEVEANSEFLIAADLGRINLVAQEANLVVVVDPSALEGLDRCKLLFGQRGPSEAVLILFSVDQVAGCQQEVGVAAFEDGDVAAAGLAAEREVNVGESFLPQHHVITIFEHG